MGYLLQDLDEYTHPIGPASNWNESRYIDFWDAERARRRLVPHRQPPERRTRRDVRLHQSAGRAHCVHVFPA